MGLPTGKVMLSRPRQTLTQSSLKNGTVLGHLLVSQQKICLACFDPSPICIAINLRYTLHQ
ncbi:hypothetical protein ACE6H2_007984 [Prunus campanulata]